MRVTVLIENESHQEGLIPEHGLALYVRHESGDVLLDAGQTGAFLPNARVLDCPVEAVPLAVLSHGHLDHADGFSSLFPLNEQVKVYARSSALDPRYNAENGRYNGVCDVLRQEYSHRFVLSDDQREILPGLWLVPDSVDHEQSLVAETERGLVVMNSCCHAGVADIVEDILQRFPGQKVHAVIGGFHLMGSGGTSTLGMEPESVRALARRLTEDLGVEAVYTGHCTGIPGFALLQETVPDRIHYIRTGDILTF